MKDRNGEERTRSLENEEPLNRAEGQDSWTGHPKTTPCFPGLSRDHPGSLIAPTLQLLGPFRDRPPTSVFPFAGSSFLETGSCPRTNFLGIQVQAAPGEF